MFVVVLLDVVVWFATDLFVSVHYVPFDVLEVISLQARSLVVVAFLTASDASSSELVATHAAVALVLAV